MSPRTDQPRDERLAAALRRLAVPEHRAGFRAELRTSLEREADRRGPRPRTSRRRRLARPWRLGLATAAAAVALAVLALMIALPSSEPELGTAADVRERVAEGWASARSVSGELIIESAGVFGPGERRWSFALTDRGDLRLTDLTRGGDLAYDAGRNVERSLSPSESMQDVDAPFGSERTGLAPGPPDQGPSTVILDRSLGSVVRALAASEGGSVREVTHEGRPAWFLETDIRVNLLAPESSPNHLEVTVDRQTGFPVRAVATRDGERVYETRVERLVVDAPPPGDAFRLEFPPGTEVFRSDAGFRRMSMDEAEAAVPYELLVPARVPDGYVLAEVAVSHRPSPTGAEGANPAVADVVSLSYRRGLDQLIVTTRPVGDDPSAWSDPLATGEGYVDDPERVTFAEGALAGRQGKLLVDPLAIPHVWAMTDRLVVTVSGDVARAELLEVAASLESHG